MAFFSHLLGFCTENFISSRLPLCSLVDHMALRGGGERERRERDDCIHSPKVSHGWLVFFFLHGLGGGVTRIEFAVIIIPYASAPLCVLSGLT